MEKKLTFSITLIIILGLSLGMALRVNGNDLETQQYNQCVKNPVVQHSDYASYTKYTYDNPYGLGEPLKTNITGFDRSISTVTGLLEGLRNCVGGFVPLGSPYAGAYNKNCTIDMVDKECIQNTTSFNDSTVGEEWKFREGKTYTWSTGIDSGKTGEAMITMSNGSDYRYVPIGIGIGNNYTKTYDKDLANTPVLYIFTAKLYNNGTFSSGTSIVSGGSINDVTKTNILSNRQIVVGMEVNTKTTSVSGGADKIEILGLRVFTRHLYSNGTFGPIMSYVSGNMSNITKGNETGIVINNSNSVPEKFSIKSNNGIISMIEITGREMTVNHKPTVNSVKIEGTEEGDLYKVIVNASDSEGDALTTTYSTPFNTTGMWQTKKGDAGNYTVTVTTTDGQYTISNSYSFTIKEKIIPNSAPTLSISPRYQNITAGETARINVTTNDSDGDNVTISYSKKFSTTTNSWTTTSSDVGVYNITITASDGKNSTIDHFIVEVARNLSNQNNQTNQTNTTNSYPVITLNSNLINITAGELVKINYSVTDLDNDTITVTFTSPLNNNGEWQTTSSDVGTYTSTMRASDGKNTTEKNITIIVNANNTQNNTNNQTNQTNSYPKIGSISYSGTYEGDTFIITITASDDDNDTLNYSCSTPFTLVGMNYCSWNSKVGDAGTYNISVSISDGKNTTVSSIIINVLTQQNNNNNSGSSGGSGSTRSSVRQVGEFNNNNEVAFNNQLEETEGVSSGTISLTGEAVNENNKTYTNNGLWWVIGTIILILLILLIIIIASIKR
ncbi:hypothetical protein COU61_03360 [Candidatus Pacearchaeota archaeon CG10_big_fil_rev_8_21_14_0_10_35_13]|nr:MAG: hypothetical protein COU61_03360 [Candidatus Pacearchaeota archaeon CG10_big_fil_rev_8_21_14_0_10_35_13]